MAQSFKEKAHLNTDREKYESNYERIFGKKGKKKDDRSKESCKASNTETTTDGQADDSAAPSPEQGEGREDSKADKGD